MSTILNCSKCNQVFSNKYNLAIHQKTVNCLKKKVEHIFICKDCNTEYSSKQRLSNHFDSCVEKRMNDEKRKFEELSLSSQQSQNEYEKLKEAFEKMKIEVNTLQTKVSMLENYFTKKDVL